MIKKNLLLPLVAVLVLAACSQQKKIDALYINGKVYTVDSTFTVAEAFAVDKGKIVEVGTTSGLLTKYKGSEIKDLNGKFVYPGFIDAHCHFYGYAMGLQKADLTGTKSFREAVERVRVHQAEYPSVWIEGRGWDQNDWDVKEFPDNRLLDSLFPDKPVFLVRIDGHAAIANTKALLLCDINKGTEIKGGVIEVKNNRLTGILVDNAVDIVKKNIPNFKIRNIAALLDKAQQNCFEAGLTTVDDAGLDKRQIDIIDSLQRENLLKMKVYAMANPDKINKAFYFKNGPVFKDRLTVCSFKVYADGALGSRGACLLKPYKDRPKEQGFLLNSPAHFDSIAHELYEHGFQMNTHCIGDSANRFILKTYASVLKGKNNRRWRIEHAQVVEAGDVERFRKYSVIPSVQPTHATSDMYWAEERLGKERMTSAYAYSSLLKQNGFVANGSDFPVEDINPLYGFYAAVDRKDKKLFPEKGFQANEKLSREQALRGMTIWAAYSNFEDKRKGSLEKGKDADFVILEKDLMKTPGDSLWMIKVLATYINGEKVFEKK